MGAQLALEEQTEKQKRQFRCKLAMKYENMKNKYKFGVYLTAFHDSEEDVAA